MKYLIPFFLLVFLSCQNSENAGRQKESTVPSAYTSYGQKISSEGAITNREAMEMMESTNSLNTKLEATILESCAMKGCWMDVKLANGEVMKVTFKDYGFFVPKSGLEGKKTIIQGAMIRKEISVEELKHYAGDAGRSEEEIAAITEPEVRLSFEASGVLIED